MAEDFDITKSCAALGVFDGVHLGHRAVIDLAVKTAGEKDLVPVAFAFISDTVTTKSFGLPIMTREQKSEMLKSVGIEQVVEADFADYRSLEPAEFVRAVLSEKLHCASVVCGYDFRFGRDAKGNSDTLKSLCKEYGIDVCVVEKLKIGGREVSSTAIREKLASGDISGANELLGYCYRLSGEVVHGRGLGHTLGFATANIELSDKIRLPKFGVYKARIIVDGKEYSGITNIGVKPTVDYKGKPVSETHIRGFSGDIYGKKIIVYPEKFLRSEKKFSSVEELKAQVISDLNYCG